MLLDTQTTPPKLNWRSSILFYYLCKYYFGEKIHHVHCIISNYSIKYIRGIRNYSSFEVFKNVRSGSCCQFRIREWRDLLYMGHLSQNLVSWLQTTWLTNPLLISSCSNMTGSDKFIGEVNVLCPQGSKLRERYI